MTNEKDIEKRLEAVADAIVLLSAFVCDVIHATSSVNGGMQYLSGEMEKLGKIADTIRGKKAAYTGRGVRQDG